MTWKTFKEMSFKKKLQWLVQYYGIVALIILVVIFIAFSFLKSVFFPEPGADVCIMILSDDIYTEDAVDMQYNLSKTYDCTYDISAYMISDPYGMQYFATRVMTDQLDIVVAPRKETEEMLSNSYISDYEIIENSDMCISIPVKARKSYGQEQAIEYIRKRLEEK